MTLEFLSDNWLDILTTVIGLIYIWLEYRASIMLWIVGILMPSLDVALYWQHGLYGDSALALYYALAAIYGYFIWKYRGRKAADKESRVGDSTEMPITHMPLRFYLPAVIFFLFAWVATWFVLRQYTNSTVPILDGFTNALSIVGLWALARKFVEQWIFWIIVDIVCCYLYAIKDIPFKAGLYGLYIIIALAGYIRWRRLAHSPSQIPNS